MEVILFSLLIAFLCLVFVSFKKIKKSGEFLDFIYGFGFIIGAFVWEDLLTFSFLFALITLVSILVQDIRYLLLGFVVFWIVRSMGETLYFFLQQFITPKHHPHFIDDHFVKLRKILGNISEQKCFILLQTTMQVITVLSICALVVFLMNWNRVPSWI